MSVTGLTIQCVGILLVMGLSLFITRSIKRLSLSYWTFAWISLAASLLSLTIAFRWPQGDQGFYFLYYLGEYSFGFFFFIGCRNYSSGKGFSRRDQYILGGLTAFALGIALAPLHPNIRFIPHFATLATFFWLAYQSLFQARQNRKSNLGLRVMTMALLLLTINFSLYVPIYIFVVLRIFPMLNTYLGYSSIYDLILETLLGFGTIMLVMEDMVLEVKEVNRELIATKEKLEALARLDPLTEALNRHAFYSLVGNQKNDTGSGLPGCAIVIDIDNLKPINDRYGHTAGDQAIREVARRLRAVIRADDMLFRWGGDEFLILLFGANEGSVRERLNGLSLDQTSISISQTTIPLIFSFGMAEFSSLREIEQAIDRADSAMYQSKQNRKSVASDKLVS